MTRQDVFVTRTAGYEEELVLASVKRHFDYFKLSEKLRPGMKVVLKPNLLMKRTPEEATTTHPAVVKGVILCLQQLGIRDIVIAESPGGPYTRAYLSPIFSSTGMRQVARETGVSLYDACKSYETEVKNPVMCSSFTLIEPFADADFVIDLPKLKTHGMMLLSGGVKNLFGTIPGLMKPELHWRFPEKERFSAMLLDLCETVRPHFVLCDAVVSMEGDGPSGGTPKQTGMLLSAESPYALDLLLCKVVGLSAKEVLTVRQAVERGLCPARVEEIPLAGDPPTYFPDFQKPRSKSIDFSEHIPKPLQALANRFLTSRPAIQASRCIGCGKCAESCPPKTIRIENRKAQIDPKGCIRCFCCHEMCPVKAIQIRRRGIFRF